MLLNAFLQFQLSLLSVFNVSLFTSRNDIIYTVLILFSFTLQHCSSSLCGGNIGTRSGVITSPLYSNTSYVNCKWFISANKWEKISLKFTSFYIGKETSPSTSSCDSYLEVLDGKDRIEKYCKGWNIHPKDTITSETSSMTLILKAKNINDNIMLTFKASFETHCTGLFTSQKDEIVSPNYPGVYPVPQYCSWKIRVPPDSVIRLHFLEFNLERTPQCNRDYVRIIDGLNSSSSRQIGPYFCANRPPPKQIRSTGNTMTLDFKAFKPTTTGRFHFYYAAEPHCGGYLRGNFGSFTSPGYTNPLYRTRNKDCIWTIEVPTEMVVSVVFATFDVKSSVRCTYDYVEIFDGSDVSATSKGRYCGSQVTNPPTVRSTKNTFTIKLHRSSSNPGRGFYATYVAVDPKNPLDKCTEASGGIVFQCNNGNYIQCFWKCDGTNDCGDGSDEQYCNDQEITKPPNKGKTSYVIILVSITSSAILIAVVIFLVDRLRRKRRSQASSRRRRRRRARMHALDSGDFRDMASPPPTYDSAVFPSSCCDAASFPPTYAESMMTTSMSEVAENTTQTVIISDVEQTGNNQGEHTQQEANNDQVITEEHGQAIEAGVEVDCVSLGESPPTSDTSPLIV